jgi:hypothetical protein
MDWFYGTMKSKLWLYKLIYMELDLEKEKVEK